MSTEKSTIKEGATIKDGYLVVIAKLTEPHLSRSGKVNIVAQIWPPTAVLGQVAGKEVKVSLSAYSKV